MPMWLERLRAACPTTGPLLRFATVGILATLLHVAVASFLAAGQGVHPALANGVAFATANVAGYVLNSCWSFRARFSWSTWRRYILVSLGGLGLTVLVAWTVERAGGHYLSGIALTVSVVPVLNFLAHRHFTYRKRLSC